MAWTPKNNEAPITFFARVVLDYIGAHQDEAIAFFNAYWGPVIDHTLERVDEASMHVGNPTDLHARALYAIPVESIQAFDNFHSSIIRIALAYTTGNTAFEGGDDPAHAQQFANTEVAGYYNLLFRSILFKMGYDDLTVGWPEIPKTIVPGVSLEIREARAKDAGVLRTLPEQGDEMLLVLEIKVEANEILPQ